MRRFLILAAALSLAAHGIGCRSCNFLRRGAPCATCPTATGGAYGDVVVPGATDVYPPAATPTVPPLPAAAPTTL